MVNIYTKEEFFNKYEMFLSNDEIKHSLMLGIGKRDNPDYLYISSVIDNHFLLGLLAGKNLILASNTDKLDLYEELVKYMELYIEYPGVVGEKEICLRYNKVYKTITNKEMHTSMDQRIYSCINTNNIKQTKGKVRLAEEKDISLLCEWAYNFGLDIGETSTKEEYKKMIESRVSSKDMYVFEVKGKIVSMAGIGRKLVKTETVNLVYTPDNYRGKGYASTLVKAVTDKIIKDGFIATLYTDLSNPTSNSIYMKIGYIIHCDSVMLNK